MNFSHPKCTHLDSTVSFLPVTAMCKWSPHSTETSGDADENPPARPAGCSQHIILIQTSVAGWWQKISLGTEVWIRKNWILDLEKSDSALTCQFRRYSPHSEHKHALYEGAGTVRDPFISEKSCFCNHYHLLNCRITIWGDTGRGEEYSAWLSHHFRHEGSYFW